MPAATTTKNRTTAHKTSVSRKITRFAGNRHDTFKNDCSTFSAFLCKGEEARKRRFARAEATGYALFLPLLSLLRPLSSDCLCALWTLHRLLVASHI
jgi:hypothetical protein